MKSEGYVKYHAGHTNESIKEAPGWKELNEARVSLHKLGLIGVYDNGVGFGNLSVRYSAGDPLPRTAAEPSEGRKNAFLISGTSTGAKQALELRDYCLVVSFDIAHNNVASRGMIQASSESMTHGAVYSACSGVNCVIHIHSRKIFDGMIHDKYPSTAADAAFGTPEIAFAAGECVKHIGAEGQIVLSGHDEGVVAYGTSIKSAFELIMDLYKKYNAP